MIYTVDVLEHRHNRITLDAPSEDDAARYGEALVRGATPGGIHAWERETVAVEADAIVGPFGPSGATAAIFRAALVSLRALAPNEVMAEEIARFEAIADEYEADERGS